MKPLYFYTSQIYLSDGYVIIEVHKFKPFKKNLKDQIQDDIDRYEIKIMDIDIKKFDAMELLNIQQGKYVRRTN